MKVFRVSSSRSIILELHIAAAVSEDNVFGLLCSGADMFAVTKEGMTVLPFVLALS
jgi:hypothetical protein